LIDFKKAEDQIMSIWYQLHVTAIAENKTAVAKFFNLDPETDVRTDSFEFSFGQKNGPGMRLGKIVEQNPDIIFLVKQSVECDTVQYWIERFDAAADQHQFILIQDFGDVENKVNKKIVDKYERKLPGLAIKHLNDQKGYEGFRWSQYFNDFNKAATMLKQAEDYMEMVNPYKYFDIKTYVIKFEYAGIETCQGPFAMEKIHSIQDRFSKMSEITNITIKEVTPR
jgi:hypothetical protein